MTTATMTTCSLSAAYYMDGAYVRKIVKLIIINLSRSYFMHARPRLLSYIIQSGLEDERLTPSVLNIMLQLTVRQPVVVVIARPRRIPLERICSICLNLVIPGLLLYFHLHKICVLLSSVTARRKQVCLNHVIYTIINWWVSYCSLMVGKSSLNNF